MTIAPMTRQVVYSVVIPVYRNEESIPLLLDELARVADAAWRRHAVLAEFVFVVDASPDRCHAVLADRLPVAPFASQLLLHARNFGSFAAIRTGLQAGRGAFFAAIAADLQDPPDILLAFLGALLKDEHQVVVGVRDARADPALSRVAAGLFWRLCRRLVMPHMPAGGVDIFGCTSRVRDAVLALREANAPLVGQLFWLGFRRQEIPYARRQRPFGRSAWTFARKRDHALNHLFAFSDLPIRALWAGGCLGLVLAFILAATAQRQGAAACPGGPGVLPAIIGLGALNLIGLAIIGFYTWRCYANTTQRPLAVIESDRIFGPRMGGHPLRQAGDIVA